MSDVKYDRNCTSYSSGINNFSRAVARIAIVQICEGLGFQSFQQSALDTLANVAVRYIREIGRIASLRAELANRSECNVFDVIQGLEDLGSIQGFLGASDVGHSLLMSGVVRDVRRYVGEAEEIPFAYLVPRFPVVKERESGPSFAQVEENLHEGYVPSWLPKFPDPETHAELGLVKKKDLDSVGYGKIQWVQVHSRKVERPSFNVRECNGSEAAVNIDQGGAAHRAAEINPYLAPPLRCGEKEVHVPVIPVKLSGDVTEHPQSCEITENHVSASETLLLVDETEDRRKILRNGRPNVHFKFINGKKSLGMSRSYRIDGFEESYVWFTDDNGGKDEMKRKAEQIFGEKIDCSQGTPHLYISDL